VADEVEHVPGPSAQGGLEVAPGATRKPLELDDAAAAKLVDGGLEPQTLVLGIELGQVVWADDHSQDPEWRRQFERLHRFRQRDVPDERRRHRQRHEVATLPVVQELPWQEGQLGSREAKLHAQPAIAVLGFALAHLQKAQDVAAEHRVEQRAAEVDDGLVGRWCCPPDVARAQKGDLERLQAVFERQPVVGHAHQARALARRRPQHGHFILAADPRRDFDLEVQIVHQTPRIPWPT
jgi:hypothetical protein